MNLALILLLIIIVLGILSFGVTNLAMHIVKFLYFVLIIAILGLVIYGYMFFNQPTDSPHPSDTERPVTP